MYNVSIVYYCQSYFENLFKKKYPYRSQLQSKILMICPVKVEIFFFIYIPSWIVGVRGANKNCPVAKKCVIRHCCCWDVLFSKLHFNNVLLNRYIYSCQTANSWFNDIIGIIIIKKNLKIITYKLKWNNKKKL